MNWINSIISRESSIQSVDRVFDNAKISQMKLTMQLILNWNDDNLNNIINVHFQSRNSDLIHMNLKQFQKYLVKNITEHIEFDEYLSLNTTFTSEDSKRARKITEFEDRYPDILYFNQKDIREEVRIIIDDILRKVVWY